jgi:cell division protein FtsB
MSAAGSYPPRNVHDDRRATPPLANPEEDPEPGGAAPANTGGAVAAPDGVDLSALSIAGITRRRVAFAAALLMSAWIILVFARQTSEASEAAARADQIARDNVTLAAEVASLEQELRLIQRPEYISQQARAYGIGSQVEIPFTLDSSVPPPGPNAPGSAALRLGAPDAPGSPLDTWLSLLFGPTD